MAQEKPPLMISTFMVLPILLPSVPSLPQSPATHYLYIQPHAPKIPDPDTSRSLFLANIPIATTVIHLKHLFSTQLSTARVERVEFPNSPAYRSSIHTTTITLPPSTKPKSRKRKRAPDVPELEATLASIKLPPTWHPPLHPSGAHAIVVFVDRAAAELALRAVKKAAKNRTEVIWGDGLDASKLEPMGSERYLRHHQATYPDKGELLKGINSYMTTFQALEEARRTANRTKETKIDEEGFVTVVRGPKAMKAGEKKAAADDEDGNAATDPKKKKGKGVELEDFYRFQMREKRKEEEGKLKREFERDRKRVEEMRGRRGKIRPE